MALPPALSDAASSLQSVVRNHSHSPDFLTSNEHEVIQPTEEHGYEHLATGTDRIVLALDSTRVIKLARPATGPYDGKQANLREHDQYQAAPPEVRRLLAPVHNVASDGTWLIMERATDIRGREHEIPDAFREAIDDAGIENNDMLVWNVGYIPSKGRDCLLDYGHSIL